MRPVLYGVLKNAPALAKVFRVVAFAAIDEERLAYKRLGELDHEMRRTLGGKQGVLLSGHGFVMTGRSIYNVVGSSYQLRQNARIQQQVMALRGRVSYLNENPVSPEPQGEGAANAGAGPQGGGRGGRGGGPQLGPPEGRDWVYWAQTIPVR